MVVIGVVIFGIVRQKAFEHRAFGDIEQARPDGLDRRSQNIDCSDANDQDQGKGGDAP